MSNRRSTVESSTAKRARLRAQVLREESVCWLCGHPVDVRLKRPDPMAPEVDHVVPVSKGGRPYDRSNARLSHGDCNRKRGNGDPDGLALFPTSGV